MPNELLIPDRKEIAVTSPMQLLQLALENNAAIDVIERLAVLQRDQRDYQARVDFDNALTICQRSIGSIAPNQKRADSTGAWWADYFHLDKTIRPIYLEQNFSIAYSQVECVTEGKVRTRATLSREGYSRDYFNEITPSTTGPKGNAVVNATDADAIAASRNKRYLLISIFNISIGIDKEEKKGVPSGAAADWLAKLEEASTPHEVQDIYLKAITYATKAGDNETAFAFSQKRDALLIAMKKGNR